MNKNTNKPCQKTWILLNIVKDLAAAAVRDYAQNKLNSK